MKSHFPKVGAFFLLVCSIVLLAVLLIHNTEQAHANRILVTATSIPMKMPIPTQEVKPTPTVIYLSQASSYSDPSVVIAIIGLFISTLSLALVVKYVIDTSAMAKATRDSAEATRKSSEAAEKTLLEMKEAREEENAPFVIVSSKYTYDDTRLNIVVENIGKSVAKDVKLVFNPPLQASRISIKDLQENVLLNNGIHSIVPNYQILIPFDFLMQYFNENLPTVYTVNVSYAGKDTLPRQEIKYDLDFNHYRYQLMTNHEPLAKIASAMELISSNVFHYTENFKNLLQDTNNISNVLSRNLARTTYAVQRQKKVDVIVGLKDFVLTWTLGYGKDKKLLLNPFLFDLRSKCLSLSEEIFMATTENSDEDLNKVLQDIGVKLCKLGNMRLYLDGYVVAHSIQGSSIEEFNDLGDKIIIDIRNLLQKIEKAKTSSSNGKEESSSINTQQSEPSGKN